MDATFQSKYIRTMSGKSVMTYVVETPSGPMSPRCWFVDVYNYNTGMWEQFAESCGTSPMTTGVGWAIWENYYVIDSLNCPSIKGASAVDIRFLDADSTSNYYQPIDAFPSDVNYGLTGGPCFGSSIYTFTYPWSSSPTNSWTAATPNP